MSSLISKLPFPIIHPDDAGRSDEMLFKDLHRATSSNLKRGRVRRNEFPLWTSPNKNIFGWKFNEWDYGKENIKLPSNARGLFSILSSNISSETDQHQSDYNESIVIRGYDKFFNLNELSFLNWDWIEKSTKGPYEVTSKENGCIIFISGLEDGTLIVTSKQSTGPRLDSSDETNHSWVGQKWVRKHLDSKNISESDFAKLLHELNVTAVGELCDDAFEEHVLAYPPEKAGIYLHGLNLNVDKFNTYPFSAVESFAKMFGFHPTEYLQINTAKELRNFLETCAETGSWKNREVEGFVIRTKAQLDKFEVGKYSDYFFKYKFEEPYLMYRQWREVTRAYLSGKNRADLRINKNVYFTNKYLDFVIPLLAQNEKLRKEYNENHGIIKVRQMFLDSMGISGSAMVHKEEEMEKAKLDLQEQKPLVPKYVLVPVSTIGCGKTTVAVSLVNLFPNWGHIQNDEIIQKPKPINFARRCMDVVRYNKPVVIADRNNHQKREREQIFNDMNKLAAPGTRNVYICLNFRPISYGTQDEKKVWETTTDRVLKRGDNHQTISLSAIGKGTVVGIMQGFVNRFQPVDPEISPDDQYDSIIDLDSKASNSSRINLEKVVRELNQKYPDLIPVMPTKEQMDKAFEDSLSYAPSSKASTLKSVNHSDANKKKQKKASPRYFAVKVDPYQKCSGSNISSSSNSEIPVTQIEEGLAKVSISSKSQPSSDNDNKPLPSESSMSLTEIIELLLRSNPSVDTKTWTRLKENNRVQSEFHVTLVHKTQGGPNSSDKEAKKIFGEFQSLYEKSQIINEKRKVIDDSNNNNKQKSNTTTDSDGFTMVEKKNTKKKNIPNPESSSSSGKGPVDLEGITTDIILKNLCWDDEVMAIEVGFSNLQCDSKIIVQGSTDSCFKEDASDLCTNKAPHITIGTINSSIPAVRAGKALEENSHKLKKIPWNIEPHVLKDQHVSAYF